MPFNPLPAPKTDVEVDVETKVDVNQESHVYVHCYVDQMVGAVRVWKTTYLIDNGSGHRSKLVHAENISYAPQWTLIPGSGRFRFLLIFDALPRACSSFDLFEDIPQAGGFHIEGILRNKSDVYHVDIT